MNHSSHGTLACAPTRRMFGTTRGTDGAARTVLRDVAFVLHLTARVKAGLPRRGKAGK